MNYGQSIKTIRVNKMKETQKEFSTKIGISQTYLSQIEKGWKKPSTDIIEKISTYSGVPIPVMFWYSITEDDVQKEKIEFYRATKNSVDSLIASFFE